MENLQWNEGEGAMGKRSNKQINNTKKNSNKLWA
jgi:hypothetical protein